MDPGDALLAAMVLGELRYGALSSARVGENLARVESLTKAGLRTRGIAKSDADLLIAATALESEATLVSRDRSFFDGTIDELEVEDW